MSKVAIHGRKLPLAPLAGGLAGVIAFGAFMAMPQSVLEALIWQTRLDAILPMAKPPLGATARLLASVAAACFAGGLTALLAWKFSGASKRPRKLSAPESAVEVAAPAATVASAPAVGVADLDEETEAEKKPSLLGRLRRKKPAEDEVDVENMPVLRRRDFHPDSPSRRPLFADSELPGESLDSLGEGSADAVNAAGPKFGERAPAPMPDWAYDEDLNLTGAQLPQGRSELTDVHPAVAALSDPVVADSATMEPGAAIAEQAPPSEDSVLEQAASATAPHLRTHGAPESAGTEDWNDTSAFEQYLETQQHAEEAVEPAVDTPDSADDAAAIATAPAVDLEAMQARLARTPISEASVEELIARLESGLDRRAARREQQANRATNHFAAMDPLANLADKEAEVDEALRAALSTLERMNRRAAG